MSNLNWQINLFLTHLTFHQNDTNIVNPATIKLLINVLEKVDEFVANVKIDNDDCSTLLCEIDETHFEIQQLIACKLCHYNIGASKGEYIAHIVSDHHNRLLSKFINEQDQIESAKYKNVVSTPISLDDNQNNNNKAVSIDKIPVNTKKSNPSLNKSSEDENSMRTFSAESERSPQSQHKGNSCHKIEKKIATENVCQEQQYSSQHNLNSHGPANHINKTDHDLLRNNHRIAVDVEKKPPISLPNVFDDSIYSFINDRSAPKCDSPKQLEDSKQIIARKTGGKIHLRPFEVGTVAQKSTMLCTKNISSELNNHRPSPIALKLSTPIKTLTSIEVLTNFFLRSLTSVINVQLENAIRLRDLDIYKDITTNIEDSLRDNYPAVKCYILGSRMIGLADEQSHVDIYIDLLNSFNTSRSKGALKIAAANAKKALQSSEDWSDVKYIDGNGHPVMWLLTTHNPSKLECNINFGIQGTAVGVYTSTLIRCLFELQNVCHQATLYIIHWFRELPSQQMRTFSRYLITLLVIFYFQSKGKLPPIVKLEKDTNIKCGDNYVKFKMPGDYQVWNECISNVLIGFFEFYATYNFKTNIISVFEGASLSKSIRDYEDKELSPSVCRFKSFVQQNPELWAPEPILAVQDIFVHRINVGQIIQSTELNYFQICCQESLDLLKSAAAK